MTVRATPNRGSSRLAQALCKTVQGKRALRPSGRPLKQAHAGRSGGIRTRSRLPAGPSCEAPASESALRIIPCQARTPSGRGAGQHVA